MAQAPSKITLSATRDIPFNKLVLSQQNVRKIKAGVSIEDLAEDIAHRGLLTSLNVPCRSRISLTFAPPPDADVDHVSPIG